jgi:hypothetical protein
MNWQRRLAALFVILVLAGCSVAAGPGQASSGSYQQDDPRDTSGMH